MISQDTRQWHSLADPQTARTTVPVRVVVGRAGSAMGNRRMGKEVDMTRDMPTPPTDDEIRDLARDFVGGRVYVADLVPGDLLPMVFAPLAFGALQDYTDEQLVALGIFAVSGRHTTTGRTVNGYPMFMEFQIWPREALIKAYELADRMRQLPL